MNCGRPFDVPAPNPTALEKPSVSAWSSLILAVEIQFFPPLSE